VLQLAAPIQQNAPLFPSAVKDVSRKSRLDSHTHSPRHRSRAASSGLTLPKCKRHNPARDGTESGVVRESHTHPPKGLCGGR